MFAPAPPQTPCDVAVVSLRLTADQWTLVTANLKVAYQEYLALSLNLKHPAADRRVYEAHAAALCAALGQCPSTLSLQPRGGGPVQTG